MSGSSMAISPGIVGDARLYGILRYAMGSAMIMMVAMGADYTLAYLTPVLALNFLSPGAKPPSLKSSAVFLLSVAIASLAGVVFSGFFLDYPLVFLPLLTLILFQLYYTRSLQNMKQWLIISLTVIPMMSMQSLKTGGIVAVNLFMNALFAMIMVWVIYFIFPKQETTSAGNKSGLAASLTPRQRFLSALEKTLVVVPALLLFFVFNLSDSLLVLVFTAVLSMNPAMKSKKAGLGIILANLGGGLAAILVFNLLTVAPSYFYLGVLTLLFGLLFAPGLFGSKPAASLYGMAFSTFLLILGSVTGLAGEAGEKVWVRIFQIGLAVTYMVVVFALVDRLTGIAPKQTPDVK
jgi:hypothetical protein